MIEEGYADGYESIFGIFTIILWRGSSSTEMTCTSRNDKIRSCLHLHLHLHIWLAKPAWGS